MVRKVLLKWVLKNQAVWGDLDGDAISEVVVPIQSCSASCSTRVSVFNLNTNTGIVTEIPLPETFVSGAIASIDSIKITSGILIVVKSHGGETTTVQFKMSEGKVGKI